MPRRKYLSERMLWVYETNKEKIDFSSMSSRKLAKKLGIGKTSAIRILRYHRDLQDKGIEHLPGRPPPQRQQISTTSPDAMTQTIDAKGGRIRTLSDLIEAAGVDLTKWNVESWKANAYEQAQKGENGPKLVTLYQVKATLRRRFTATLEPAKSPVNIPPRENRPSGDVKTAMFIPDSQVGYRWRRRFSYLEPMHDRKAMDCVIQALERMKPDVVVLLGDMADLGPLSKYTSDISVRGTTQATVDELHWWLARVRLAAGPDAEIVYMAGNHEKRLEVSMIPNDLEGVKAAKDEDRLLTLRRLLRLDELRIEYVGPYGADWWMWDGLIQVTHGNTVRSGGGSTAASVVKGLSRASQVFGHIHRLELACRTIHGPKGEETLVALSPGCLCRTDGGGPPGYSDAGRDWQQGIGIAYLHGDKVHLSTIPIHAGSMIWEGEPIIGLDRVNELVKATGWKQFRKL